MSVNIWQCIGLSFLSSAFTFIFMLFVNKIRHSILFHKFGILLNVISIGWYWKVCWIVPFPQFYFHFIFFYFFILLSWYFKTISVLVDIELFNYFILFYNNILLLIILLYLYIYCLCFTSLASNKALLAWLTITVLRA